MGKIYKILPAAILLLLAFIPSPDPPPSGWYQQFMPYLGGRQITDVFFLDSLIGWSVTNATNQANDTTYVLKTTNRGDNWVILYRKTQTGGGFPGLNRVYFINANTGYICGVTGIDKSTDGGISWVSLNAPLNNYLDMSALNENLIWLASSNPLTGGVYRTTDGGANWDRQAAFGNNPAHIYMYNARIGFIDAGSLRRTTDGGTSWTPIIGAGNFLDMYFADSLTGWKCNLDMKKTTDGGLNWITQVLPDGGNIVINGISKISNINDTIWGVGGVIQVIGGGRGMLFKTVNGGTNWLFQVPDTSIHIFQYFHIKFVNNKIGWSYNPVTGIHTTEGGDTTFYTGIQSISNAVPEKFILKQNYPNPFNPRTVIPYSLSASAHVKIIAYDITGKEVQRLVDNYQHAGAYEVDFMGKFTASGVYFYRMEVDGEVVGTKKMILLK